VATKTKPTQQKKRYRYDTGQAFCAGGKKPEEQRRKIGKKNVEAGREKKRVISRGG